MQADSEVVDQTSRAETVRALRGVLGRYATLIGFVAIVVFFSVAEPQFGTWGNFRSILDQSAALVILGVGLTVVLTVGEFDLSFPGIVALSAVVAVKLMGAGHGATIAIAAAVSVGLGAGLVAGVVVSLQRASSFIVTLALSTVWTGIALGVSSEGRTLTTVTDGYIDLTLRDVAGLPLGIVYAFVVSVLVFAILRWSVFGRHAQAIGANAVAARLAGIRLSQTRIVSFAVLGLCSGMAAVVLSSRNGAFSSDISTGLFIPPFVAAFFGISVLAAGRFNVFGTVVGALFIGTLQTGLIFLGAQRSLSNVITGLVLVVILLMSIQSSTHD